MCNDGRNPHSYSRNTILGFIYLLAGFMMFAAMQTILLDTDIGDAIAALVLTLLLIGAALPFFGHAHAA